MSKTGPEEEARLAALLRYEVLDTRSEPGFDRIVRVASQVLQCPISLVSLVDRDRQWFKARVGLDATETPRGHAFCHHTIQTRDVMVVPDASRDPRFRENPLVRGPPHIRFYAGAPLLVPDGHRIGTLCVIDKEPRELSHTQLEVLRDLADMVVSELELRAQARTSERRLELLRLAEEVADVGHWYMDLARNEIFWSPQAYRISGLDPNGPEVTIESAFGCYHPDDRPLVEAAVRDAARQGTPIDVDLRVVRPDGETRNVSIKGRVRADGKASEALVGVVVDVTDRERTRFRLAQMEEMASVGSLAAGIAHEINNPLSFMVANLESLAETFQSRQGDPVDETLEMLDEFREGTRRIQETVQNLKDYATTTEPRMVRLDLRKIAEDAIRVCGHEVRHRLDLVTHMPEQELVTVGDRAQLTRALVNAILHVAREACRIEAHDHVLTIRLGREVSQAYVELVHRRSGAQGDVSGLEPYVRTQGADGSSGLGLSISHGIVTAHGGQVRLAESPCTLRLRIDVPSPAPEAAATSGGMRVLMVDDEDLVGRAMARRLRPHQVTVETDGRKALSRIEGGEAFDVVLCDLMMPKFSGADFYHALQTRHPELSERVIFMTGGTFSDESREFASRVQAPVFDKPVDIKALLRAIEALGPNN